VVKAAQVLGARSVRSFAVKTNAFATVIVIRSVIWLVGDPSSFLAAPTLLIIRGRVEAEFKFLSIRTVK